MAKIYFSNFDSKKINADGWNCGEGQLYMKLTSPFDGKAIDVFDEAIEKNKFRYIGEIDVESPDEAWTVVQNIDSDHELNDRSMMIGDVIVINNKGFIVDSVGFSELSKSQLQKLKKVKK